MRTAKICEVALEVLNNVINVEVICVRYFTNQAKTEINISLQGQINSIPTDCRGQRSDVLMAAPGRM